MSSPSSAQAVVLRHFSAPAGRVFDAWLDTALIGRWMFGPSLRDERIVRLQTDARVGGSFSFVVERQGAEIDHVGTYLEIDRPRRLVFTWGIRANLPETSRVTVEITPQQDGGCTLKLVHEIAPAWAAFAGKAAESWTRMLAALESVFRSEPA